MLTYYVLKSFLESRNKSVSSPWEGAIVCSVPAFTVLFTEISYFIIKGFVLLAENITDWRYYVIFPVLFFLYKTYDLVVKFSVFTPPAFKIGDYVWCTSFEVVGMVKKIVASEYAVVIVPDIGLYTEQLKFLSPYHEAPRDIVEKFFKHL